MAITRYDSPAQMQVMNTYVPIPFDALAQAGMQKQKRYEEGLVMEEELGTGLDNVKALDRVFVPGKGYVEVGDAKAVKAKTDYFKNSINDIVLNYKDKSSPVYRAKILGLAREMKREFAPDGTIGRAMQNYSTYGDINKRLSTNEELQGSPYLALGVARELEDYAASSKEGVGYLAGQAAVGKDPKMNEKLTSLLSNLKSNIVDKVNEDLANGIIRNDQVESVTSQRVAQATYDAIMNTPELEQSIRNKVEWANRMGNPTTFEDEVNNLAGNMSNIFAFSKQKKDIKLDSGWGKAQADKEFNPLEVPTVQRVPGTEIASYQELQNKLGDARKRVEEIDKTISKYKQALAKSTTMTDPTGRSLNQVSIQSELYKLEGEKKELEANNKTLEGFKQLALTNVGLDDAAIEKEYGKEVVAEAKRKAAALPEDESLRIFGIDTGEKIKVPKSDNAYMYFLPGAVSSRAAKFTELDKNLKEISENYVYSSNAITLSKQHREQSDDENYKTALLSGGNLKWTDTEHEAGKQVDPKEVNVKNMRFIGIDKNPNTGERVNKYALTNDEGVVIGTMASPMSRAQESNYISKGQLTAPNEGYEGFTNYMKNKLSGITAEGTIKTSDSPDAKTIQVVKPQRPGEKYYVRFETGDKDANGNPVYGRAWPANSESELYENLWGALHYNN